MIRIDKGDYLTFASIATALHLKVDGPPVGECEVKPGVWRRHPDIGDHSRSDISRDGYMGVMFMALVKKDRTIFERIRKAGWKRRWTMGDRGHWDYTNMAPLVPVFYAEKWKWFPTLPTLCTPWNNTGFRAHLLALIILIEHLMGKRRRSHRQGAGGLHKKNPDNPWFEALHCLVHGHAFGLPPDFEFSREEGGYRWGSCPAEVFEALTRFTARETE